MDWVVHEPLYLTAGADASDVDVRWEPMLRLLDPASLPDLGSARVTAVSSEDFSPPDSPSDTGSPTRALDIADVPAVEVVLTVGMHLMSAAAVACGLAEDEQEPDLAEARILINALAGLVTASAPDLGSMHAAPMRDGLKSLQLAFREASTMPDPPGLGPGENLTGSVI